MHVKKRLRARARRGHRHRALASAPVLLAALVLPASASAVGAFTWSGAAVSARWSAGNNWSAGAAPSGAVGSLTFPRLTSAACLPPASVTGPCYTAIDNVGPLQTDALFVDPVDGYQLTPATSQDTITLGAGGLSAVAPPGPSAVLPSVLSVPVELAAPQTWTVDGSSSGADLKVAGGVTGAASDPLSVNLSNHAYLKLAGSVDAGPASFDGGTAPEADSGAVVLLGGDVNGANGQPVLVAGTGLVAKAPETVGPLTVSGGYLGVGDSLPSSGELDVAGNLTLDSSSTFGTYINAPGSVPYVDFSQLSATGNVDLGGATLDLLAGATGNTFQCGALRVGAVDALIVTTSGTVSGTFAGVPDGAIVPFDPVCSGLSPQLEARINYGRSSVTATVISAPSSTGAPSGSGGPPVGQIASAPTAGVAPAAPRGSGGATKLGSLRLEWVKASGRAVRLAVSCAGARCSIAALLSVSRPRVIVGRRRLTVAAGHRRAVRIALDARGRRLLARHRTLHVIVSIVQSGRTVARETVTFRSRAKRR